MKNRMTQDRWLAILETAEYGLDACHDDQHGDCAVHDCPRCRDAYEGLRILRAKFYNQYIEPKDNA